ncbi:uncharacterized protein LOC135696119 [Rhopilema esculentum]|uniref:uncharacterized protein LOC135696119 n=1 Tax=Rhopilema esculentum TaxID=499914 RepID=UPI0031DA6CC2
MAALSAAIGSCLSSSSNINFEWICALCFKELQEQGDRNLIEGKSSFNVVDELNDLPFKVVLNYKYICKRCLNALKKRKGYKTKLAETDKQLFIDYTNKCNSELKVHRSTGEDDDGQPPFKKSSRNQMGGNKELAHQKVLKSIGVQTTKCFQRDSPLERPVDEGTRVFVRAEWQSVTKEKQLPVPLESLGKMLVRGSYKQIAAAAWKSESLKPYIISLVLKCIHNECARLTARKNPSMMRKLKGEDIVKFKFEDLNEDIFARAPLFHGILKTASMSKLENASYKTTNYSIPAVCMAASICMKARSPHATLMQLLVSLILQHCSLTSAMARLRAVKLTVSHPCITKKLDEFGKMQEESFSALTQGGKEDAVFKMQTLPSSTMINQKIVFDNIDYQQHVHYMSESHQNPFYHWVSYMSTENRISASHLVQNEPQKCLDDMPNSMFLPNKIDHSKQRQDYIFLTARLCTEYIECLKPLGGVVRKHMPHKHSKETFNATKTVFHGCIYENENDADGIKRVIEKLHKFTPCSGKGEEKVYSEQGFVGDQLSVERGVNCLLQASNGFTQEEQFTGMHFEVGDFHATMKFLQVGFDYFYNGAAASDQCTMFADSIYINRRNIGSKVKQRYSACKRFFQMEVQSRVIAAAMEILGIKCIDEKPDQNHFPASLLNESAKCKKDYIEKLATIVVDTYVLKLDKFQELFQKSCLAHSTAGDVVGISNRRFQCTKTFANGGDARKKHEASHVEGIPDDDCYNYQLALMDYGMVVENFIDAISEGDGERILRCWKFVLLYLKADGKRSCKYSLEAFYLICQAYCLLSPCAAYNLIWNRFAKNQNGYGGNIPLDLALEQYNRILKNVLRMLGPNASNSTAVDRYCKALSTTKKFIEQWDSSSSFICHSGKHRSKHASEDTKKIIKHLMEHRALKFTSGRKYKHYNKIKQSIITDLDMSALFQWINEHRRLVKVNKAAR